MFVANAVAKGCELVGVWQEEKSFRPERYAREEADQETIRRHFALRDASEASYFGADSDMTLDRGAVHRTVTVGGCNDPGEVTLMAAARPDIVFVFGTGILRDPFLPAFEGRILNIHLGLSPYYRGAGTNFWPLVNREPEYVGATIHYLDAGIDTGPILCHARPVIESDDGPHDLGNKTIVAAVEALLRAGEAHLSGNPHAVPQWGGGRLYRRKDFSADAVRALYGNFDTGMVAEYLAAHDARDALLRLVAPGRAA